MAYLCADCFLGAFFETRIVVPSPPPSTTPTPSSQPSSTTLRSSVPPLSCSSGFQSCPASQGGGCCPSGASCGAVFCSPPSTAVLSSGSAAPPVRPTSDSPPSITSAPPSITGQTGEVCPNGYYMCSAYYRGGCCRVGRDCDSVSCPEPATATILNSNGITIAAPSGSLSPVSRACADGWYSCAASVGGECCPSGYNCGDTCTATASGGGTVQKQAPNSGGGYAVSRWLLTSLAALVVIGMIVL